MTACQRASLPLHRQTQMPTGAQDTHSLVWKASIWELSCQKNKRERFPPCAPSSHTLRRCVINLFSTVALQLEEWGHFWNGNHRQAKSMLGHKQNNTSSQPASLPFPIISVQAWAWAWDGSLFHFLTVLRFLRAGAKKEHKTKLKDSEKEASV